MSGLNVSILSFSKPSGFRANKTGPAEPATAIPGT